MDIDNILKLAGDGYSVQDIRKFTRVRLADIIYICEKNGVMVHGCAQVEMVEPKKVRSQVAPTPYDDARATLTPYAFAELVLKSQGLLTKLAGQDAIDGKIATPLLKMREANRVLKRLGLKQIDQNPAWLV